jgi:Family of unknown function (DUF6335)
MTRTITLEEIDDSGRLREELRESAHIDPGSSPELSGGDVDARWDQAEASGEETVGGSNPTPDQDIVDEIGRAVGITYQEGEPLRVGRKEEERDEHRWELDPASAEDYGSRTREEAEEVEAILKMKHVDQYKKTSE